ncbi:hypothetical protein HDU93_004191 [Gonapodya sp. JEL0774]|nr:hypothetical protein HDU93_004191 [Gonapodya sp. JEL0774]
MRMTGGSRGATQSSAPPAPSSSSSGGAGNSSESPTRLASASSGPALPIKYRVPTYLLETPVALSPDDDPLSASTQSTTPTLVVSLSPAASLVIGSKNRVKGIAAGKAISKDGAPHGVVPTIPLPTAWNPKDKCALLELTRMNMRLNYNGAGKSDGDAASVRANAPMPPQAGIFYFEVDVLSKGRDGHIGVGFCWQNVSLNRLPGWEPNSWGYHGDDGHSFSCSGTAGRAYGPTFTTSDVIGCCVNFWSNTAFYTKNGQALGTAFRDVCGTGNKGGAVLYPAVGLRTPGEVVEVNFGQRAFRYDIEGYFKEERAKLWLTIHASPIPSAYLRPQAADNLSAPSATVPPPSNSTNASIISASGSRSDLPALPDLVLEYLVHHGYAETAEVFKKGMKGDTADEHPIGAEGEGQVSQEGMKERQKMIRDVALASGALEANSTEEMEVEVTVGQIDNIGENGNGNLTDEDAMEVDEQSGVSTTASTVEVAEASGGNVPGGGMVGGGKVKAGRRSVRSKAGKGVIAAGGGAPMGTTTAKRRVTPATGKSAASPIVPGKDSEVDKSLVALSMLREAMRYGQQLQDEFKTDEREDVKETLIEIFSLVAYPDPYASPAGYLLDISEREAVANALNSAILAAQGRPTMPALEKLYRQSVVSVRELVRQGVGAASFVNVQKDVLV